MIYVHIPFCHSKCAYCDFYSIPDRRRMHATVERILEEFNIRKPELGEGPLCRTLYFGGGTPSILEPDLFSLLAHGLLRADECEEFTIEVNPEDVSEASATHWAACGVNRISMGIQSFDDKELRAVGRRHTAEDATKAFSVLRAAGFDNISCDLIYGLPGQSLESWVRSIQHLLALKPEHISAYCLSYEPGTLLTRRLEEGRIEEASEELVEAMYEHLCESLADAGFEHYEISNFALPGRKSRHNSAYWTGTPYLGLGPGAHSLDAGGVRRFNPSDIRAYTAPDGPFPICVIDEEDSRDRLNDKLITALRTAHGLNLAELEEHNRNELMNASAPFIKRGTLRLEDGRLVIPEKAWLQSDAILRELLF
ncbi:MAG: radical SAM family heme chaperone HemW [Muribaculaceae bacterium]|nr:radical SAM family heme chaperone HemW [Muribaculaceae bacterium]